jgi:hypothetical protein
MYYLPNKWYQNPWWWYAARWQGYEKVPFADGAGTCGPYRNWSRDGGGVYLEPTQVYIGQGKPNKAHTTILEKDPTKRVANGF